jgi:hypothetical protein
MAESLQVPVTSENGNWSDLPTIHPWLGWVITLIQSKGTVLNRFEILKPTRRSVKHSHSKFSKICNRRNGDTADNFYNSNSIAVDMYLRLYESECGFTYDWS